jgi:hypothetical protein
VLTTPLGTGISFRFRIFHGIVLDMFIPPYVHTSPVGREVHFFRYTSSTTGRDPLFLRFFKEK